MANIWISQTGNDTTGDGSEATPYKTISKALSEHNDGDIIKGVASATAYPISSTALANANVIFEGTTFVGDPTTPNFEIDCGSVGPQLQLKEHLTFRDLVIKDFSTITAVSFVYVVSANASSNATVNFERVRLQNLELYASTGSRGGFVGNGGSLSAGSYNRVTVNLDQVEFDNVKAVNSTSYVSFFSLGGNGYLNATNCTYYADNTGFGLKYIARTGHSTSPIAEVIHKNWAIKNLHADTIDFGNGTIETMNGGVYDSSGNITLPSGATNMIDGDPLFNDPTNHIFEVKPNSPCHNGGQPV